MMHIIRYHKPWQQESTGTVAFTISSLEAEGAQGQSCPLLHDTPYSFQIIINYTTTQNNYHSVQLHNLIPCPNCYLISNSAVLDLGTDVAMYVCYYCPLARDEANNYVSCVRHGMCVASSPRSPIFFKIEFEKLGVGWEQGQLVCVYERQLESGGRDGGREKLFSFLCTVESDKEKPQYKSLLDLPNMSRELTEKLDEYSNPSRSKSHT